MKYLEEHPDTLKEVSERKKRLEKYKDRTLEKEDKEEVIELKAKKLANVINNAKHLIVYSGAGISTSAKIPDYRGSQGIWTLLQKGEEIGEHDLSLAEPTYTHMALHELHKKKILKYVVSQNCDGLHLRSGLPRFSLSEVHGNMYVEVCKSCKPALEYWRIFDTTPLTSRFQHKTNRTCRICGNPLIDTIVHFGERGSLKWPLNWSGATKAVEKADVIVCLGSSLKVLKKYPWLWALDRPLKTRPKVYIVNLQWTPKDSIASIKINGKCDEVMKIVMKHLKIEVPNYDRSQDPIFHHASLLKEEELHTTSQPMLKRFIFKGEESSEMDESNTGTYSSEKQTPSIESEDSKSQTESLIRNFSSIKSEDAERKVKTEEQPEVAVKMETSSSIKVKCEDDKSHKVEDISEVLDLTESNEDEVKIVTNGDSKKTNGNHQSKDDVIDFEELIDNLEMKVSPKKDIEVKISPKKEVDPKPEIENGGTIKQEATVPKPESLPSTPTNDPKELLQQNQNLIDMALLNNSLLTASLALTPVNSTSPEALTATALILNYNNQIINTLTNNLNLMPYSSVENGTASVLLESKQNCDNNVEIRREILENDIEMVDTSDEDEPERQNGNKSSPDSAEQYYKQLLTSYCMAINENLPKWSDGKDPAKENVTWSDVNYAYSGLHTIVNLPPEDANMWKNGDENGHESKRIRRSTAAERKAAKAECKFCWDNYEQMECQFYKPINRDFKIASYRNNKLIVCECCDFTEDEEEEQTEEDNSKLNGDDKEKPGVVIRAGWFGKGENSPSSVKGRVTETFPFPFQATERSKRSARNKPPNGTGFSPRIRLTNEITSGV